MQKIRKPFTWLICLMLLANLATAQKNQAFPSLSGETLTGKAMSLPQATKGKKTLLGLAYSKKSDELLRAWYQPMYTAFVAPPQNSMFPTDEGYDINMYFIAMMQGIYKVADNTVNKKMKEGLDPKFHDRTIVYQGKIKEYKDQLQLGQKDFPYFFVLDETGKIIHHTSGVYTRQKMFEIQKALADD